MRLKDFLPLILNKGNYPLYRTYYVRILQERKTRYEVVLDESFHGKAQDVPYYLLDKEIKVLRACRHGNFVIHLVSKEGENE